MSTLLLQARFRPINVKDRIKEFELRKEEVTALELHLQSVPLLPSQIRPRNRRSLGGVQVSNFPSPRSSGRPEPGPGLLCSPPPRLLSFGGQLVSRKTLVTVKRRTTGLAPNRERWPDLP